MGYARVYWLYDEREDKTYALNRNYFRKTDSKPWYWVDHSLLSKTVPVQRRFASRKVSGDFYRSTPYTGVIYRRFGGRVYPQHDITVLGDTKHHTDVVVSSPLITGNLPNILTGGLASSSTNVWWLNNSKNRAEAEALVKLADRKLDVGMAVVELKETSGYLAKNISTFARTIMHLRRGNVRGFIKELRSYRKRFSSSSRRDWSDFERNARRQAHFKSGEVSSRWLEFNYAIVPLLNDIYGLAQVFNEGIAVRSGPTVHARRTLTEKSVVTGVGGGPDYVGSAPFEHKYRVRLTARVDNAHWSALQLLGLGNPAELAWAAVPFSFVVDWAIPISTWLAALSAPMGLEFVKGSFSVKHSSTITWTYQGQSDMTCRAALRIYHRIPYSTFPVPMPYVKNPLSGSHLATAAALLRQIF